MPRQFGGSARKVAESCFRQITVKDGSHVDEKRKLKRC
jgi:hypothetical protein